jgi:hypothetical protein
MIVTPKIANNPRWNASVMYAGGNSNLPFWANRQKGSAAIFSE